METRIDLPDDLVATATRMAMERGLTLCALVDRGLRKELGLAADGAGPAERESQNHDTRSSRSRVGWG